MIDRRESVMLRLVELAGGLVGADHVARNRITLDDLSFSQIFVLEGDEEAAEDDLTGRAPMVPRRIHMVPQIVPVCRAKAADVGSEINGLRQAVIDAVLNDSTLHALTLNGRSVRYEGMESDLGFGRQMIGQMALRFRITVIMKPGASATA